MRGGKKRKESSAHPQPISSTSRLNESLGVKEHELFTSRSLHSYEKFFVFTETWFSSRISNDKDTIGLRERESESSVCLLPHQSSKGVKAYLANTGLSPGSRNCSIGYVKDDSILLFVLGEPSSEFELTHSTESVST